MLPPFEHMLRNAVVHGIESPADRVAARQAGDRPHHHEAAARRRRGRHRRRGRRRGPGRVGDPRQGPSSWAAAAEQELTDDRSDAADPRAGIQHREPADAAGRSRRRHGRRRRPRSRSSAAALFIESKTGYGARFTIRLPFTLAITPGADRARHDELLRAAAADRRRRRAPVAQRDRARISQEDRPTFEYGGNSAIRFQHLGPFVGSGPSRCRAGRGDPVILVRAGEHSTALVTDELVGSREIVVKSVGPADRGRSAAFRARRSSATAASSSSSTSARWCAPSGGPRAAVVTARGRPASERIFALVVDDSITVRRVTQRLLERNGMRV
jgi:chemosensory pili system protein ChpA (sensor histidine kinase/response regulator)